MSPRALWSVLRRRWWLVAAGLAVTIGLGVLATAAVPAHYEASADVLILPPPGPATAVGDNPYLALTGYQPVIDVLARALSDQKMVAELNRRGVVDPFTAGPDPTTNGPVLAIVVTGRSAAQAVQEMSTIVDRVEPVLQQLQEDQDVGPTARLTSTVITADSEATPIRNSQVRALIVALAAGLFATVALIAFLEGAARRRSADAGADVATRGRGGAPAAAGRSAAVRPDHTAGAVDEPPPVRPLGGTPSVVRAPRRPGTHVTVPAIAVLHHADGRVTDPSVERAGTAVAEPVDGLVADRDIPVEPGSEADDPSVERAGTPAAEPVDGLVSDRDAPVELIEVDTATVAPDQHDAPPADDSAAGAETHAPRRAAVVPRRRHVTSVRRPVRPEPTSSPR